jgi:hypothetical protein
MSEYLLPLNEAANSLRTRVILTDSGFACAEGVIASANINARKPKIRFSRAGETFAPTESVRFTVLPDMAGYNIAEILKNPETSTVPVYEVKVPKALIWLRDLSDIGAQLGYFTASTVAGALLVFVTLFSHLSPHGRSVAPLEKQIAISAAISQEFHGRKDYKREITPKDERRFEEMKEKAKEFFK